MFLEPFNPSTSQRHARRGFTLIELVVVVVIIGITAALATPQVVEQMRERRARQAAQAVALVYSSARMRAMGRGAAVLVQYRKTTGTFTVRESIEGAAAIARGQPNCATQPGMGCLTTQWSIGTESRVIETVNLDAANNWVYGMYDSGGTEQAQFDVCFTPLGRSFASTTGLAPTAPMTTPATFRLVSGVKSGRTFFPRNVVILPNGMARVAL